MPRPPPGDLSDPAIEPTSPALQVDSLPTEPPGKLQSVFQLPSEEEVSKWCGELDTYDLI